MSRRKLLFNCKRFKNSRFLLQLDVGVCKMYFMVNSSALFFWGNKAFIGWVRFLLFLSDVIFHTEAVWINSKVSK